MDEKTTLKLLSQDQLDLIFARKGFDYDLFVKDYFVTILLYLMRNIKGVYFKGGTALNKIFLNYSRISEDIDFSVERDITGVIDEIKDVISESTLFGEITKDKHVTHFVRLIVHYDGYRRKGVVLIDLNKKAKLLLKPEKHEIPHFYGDAIPSFSVATLAQKEMMGEKMAATIGRNKPRDHFDLYKIIKAGYDIDLDIVAKKCTASDNEFDIVKMFNRAKKLKKRWDEDMGPLLEDDVSFEEVMTTLAKHFKLKEEKEKRKKLD